jgi:tetratricopeptide (TPR) repeat protein
MPDGVEGLGRPESDQSQETRQHVVGSGRAQQGIQGTGYQVNIFPPQLPSLEPGDVDSHGPLNSQSPPSVWNVVTRNPGFTGRQPTLKLLRKQLTAQSAVTVQAVAGMGGIGKTQLAIEYAHRFARKYDIVWWINAEQVGLISEQLSVLGARLGLVAPATDMVTTVKRFLREHDRWLLIFDNASHPQDLREWLPGGDGHVLITSRHRGWSELGRTIDLEVFDRAESIALVRSRNQAIRRKEADAIAEELGDLPLALVQAASFMAETATTPREFLALLATHAGELLDFDHPPSYSQSLAATILMAADRLAQIDQAAVTLLRVCAFLAPEPIPSSLLDGAPARNPCGMLQAATTDPAQGAADVADPLTALATMLETPVALRRSIRHIGNYALASTGRDGIRLHRLTQAVLRDHLPLADTLQVRRQVDAILAAAKPGDPALRENWDNWALLLPHILVAKPEATTCCGLRALACHATWYLIRRGSTRSAQQLAEFLFEAWRERLGADDRHTLWMANNLAWAWYDLGQYGKAQEMDQDTLARRRRLLGDDHPDTLLSANNLGNALHQVGRYEDARAIHQDTLARRRQVLGERHPRTLASMGNLARARYALGDFAMARTLHQQTMAARREVLGYDHPDTLLTAHNLGNDLAALGLTEQARALHKETLDIRQRTLGKLHPDTLTSMHDLAGDLVALGRSAEAVKLYEAVRARRLQVLGSDHPDTVETTLQLKRTQTMLDTDPEPGLDTDPEPGNAQG